MYKPPMNNTIPLRTRLDLSALRSSSAKSRGFLVALAAISLSAASTQAQTLLTDDFNGSSVNTSIWANGSTGSLGVTTVSGSAVNLDVNQEGTARNALLSNQTDINPFAKTLTITMTGLGLSGTPGLSTQSLGLYAVVGRIPSDTGGAANAGLAATYSAGGSLGTGGSLGLSILNFSGSSNNWRLQVLDSGSSNPVSNVLGNITLSGMPTGLIWTIDGAAKTFSITLTGATFASGAFSGLSTASGSFVNFTSSSLVSGSDVVSRLAIGGNNNNTVIDGATATFGSVLVTAVPEPSTFALLGMAVLGIAIVRRRRLAAAC